jgi:hypothetical protein
MQITITPFDPPGELKCTVCNKHRPTMRMEKSRRIGGAFMTIEQHCICDACHRKILQKEGWTTKFQYINFSGGKNG